MSEILSLGYLGFNATDLEEWKCWATEILGLQIAETPPDAPEESIYFRMDERAWRFSVEQAEVAGLAFTGWEVADEGALGRLHDRLTAAGIVAEFDAEAARRRQVEALLRCEDPDGNSLEFYYGAFISRHPFISPRGVRFITGELGLGHILNQVGDEKASRHFYFDVLGFQLSDTISFGSNKVFFTHVNPRHHSLAFVEVAGKPPALGHFMVEVDSLDAVGVALDRVNSGPTELTETLGKHTNDHMISFYMRNPSGSQTEYGWAGRTIESGWSASSYDATAYWGHQVPGSEYSATGPMSPREGA
ncbi:VOC family protein [Rhodococcus erythropolis]|uniref:VOC family protein n=1 Tax=Rhodococcus erythropolis TaxID=1833 RepID=UPI001BE6210F|nr:VOC family protein [Rhodococcus erythropolis]MBT2268983.1 VOC family protein [Rhodococcus erythropolis]